MILSIVLILIGFVAVLLSIYVIQHEVIFMSGVVLIIANCIYIIIIYKQSHNIHCVSEIDSNDIKTYYNCWFDKGIIRCKDYRISIPNGYRCSIEKQMEKN